MQPNTSTVTRPRPAAGRGLRTAAVLAAAAALAAGCAEPGELGGPPLPAETVTVAPPVPEPPDGPVELGRGIVEAPVSVDTPGPAVFSVRTIIVPPGGTTEWHQHPGTETSVVTSGQITLIREGDCEIETIGAGQAVFIPDQERHLARNDGAVPAELVVTYLLAPDAPERLDVEPAC